MTTTIKVSSIDPTALNTLQGPRITSVQVDVDSGYTSSTANAVGLSGGYVSINGSGFVTGCSVIIGSLIATSVSFVSSIKVNCLIPAQIAGTYTIYLTNPDGSTAIRVNGVQYSSTPTWVTSGTQSSTNPISLQLSSTSDTTVSYALQAGSSLPSGMTLTSGGLLSGSVTGSGTTTYNFTIVATDVELQYTPQAFAVTISFTDPYFYLTTVAVNADNNSTGTILSDASTNAFEMTVAGTPRASNFTPFGTGWSNYFTSSTPDYLTVGSSGSPLTALGLGTGAFTIEFWVYPASAPNTWNALFDINTYASGILMRYQAGVDSLYILGTAYNWSPTTNLILNQWSHVVLARNGSGAFRLYVNGTSIISGTNAGNLGSTGYMTINAAQHAASQNLTAYYSNFRIIKGSALYDPTVSTLTVPTIPLTAISNTSILTCQSNQFIDNSASPLTLTRSGTPAIQSFNPFNLTNTGSNGAMYFNGTTDYLTTATATPLVLSGSVWTIELWCYLTSSDFTGYRILVNKRNASSAASYDLFFNITNGYLAFYNGTQYTSTAAPPINAWNHVVAVYDGTNINLFMNGVRVLQTSTSNPDNGGNFYIGVDQGGTSMFFAGYISNVRILKGTALYSGTTYTIPTVPLTAITNTNLLILQNKYSHNTTQGHQDSSTNQLLITSAGSPAAGNFTPFSQTGWSNYFNGSTDYFSAGSNSAFAFGTGAYTVEFWIYPTVVATSYGGGGPCFVFVDSSGGWGIWDQGSSGLKISARAGSDLLTSSTHYTVNSWNHIAAVRSGTSANQTSIFLNGTRIVNGTDSTNWTITGPLLVGAINLSGYFYTGYMNNVRVVKGTAIYDPTQATITVPTSALTAVANTQLLTCQSNRFIDKSTNAFTLTTTGTPSVQSFSPLAPTAAYSASTVGGSVYTGTTSDWINVANSNSLKLSTSDFTIECWIYFMNPNSQTYYGIVGKRTADASVGYLLFGLNSGFGLFLLASSNGSGWDIANSSGSTALKKNVWYHVALVRSGSSIKAYLNGALEITVTSSAAIYDNTAALSIGNWSETQSSYPFIGYISNFRFQIGTAQYTTIFATPTSLVTATANTNVMVDSTSTALTDVSSRYNLITTSLAKISTAVSKFGTGSMFFGTGNYITAPSSVLAAWGTGDFTIETWIYLTSVAADTCIIDGRDGTGTAVKPCLFVQSSSGNFLFYVNGGIRIQGGTYSLSTWQHVAVCRSSGSTKMFVAGTQVGSTYTDANSYLTCALRIGYFNDGTTTNSFNGYMDDFRITRYARYTTTFTPPTTTFKDQ